MITLKTLAQATAQEVFDQVAKHMLKQNKRSESSNGACKYRSDDGLKCAAGCLISDDEYITGFDDDDETSWSDLIANYPDLVPSEHQELIVQLQIIHDFTEVNYWYDDLNRIAKSFNLKMV